MIKNCFTCSVEFVTYQYLLNKGYGRYCSKQCHVVSQTKLVIKNCLICNKQFRVHLFRHKEGMGNYCSASCSSQSRWKDGKQGVKSIHQMVKRKLGQPNRCELCNKTEGNFDWANKDHKYSKDLRDWMRLCRSCHRKYDIANNSYKSIQI